MVQISGEAHVSLTLAGIILIVPGIILLVGTLTNFIGMSLRAMAPMLIFTLVGGCIMLFVGLYGYKQEDSVIG
jgi:hypothetical protein